jgi:hypothetical protein
MVALQGVTTSLQIKIMLQSCSSGEARSVAIEWTSVWMVML